MLSKLYVYCMEGSIYTVCNTCIEAYPNWVIFQKQHHKALNLKHSLLFPFQGASVVGYIFVQGVV